MPDLLALVAPLATLTTRDWVGITFALIALITYSTAMMMLGAWAVRR